VAQRRNLQETGIMNHSRSANTTSVKLSVYITIVGSDINLASDLPCLVVRFHTYTLFKRSTLHIRASILKMTSPVPRRGVGFVEFVCVLPASFSVCQVCMWPSGTDAKRRRHRAMHHSRSATETRTGEVERMNSNNTSHRVLPN
jgi:hypothetical protein